MILSGLLFVVALITRTIRGIDTEVELGPDDGMPVACAIGLDNLRTVPRALLTERITRVDEAKMDAVCRAPHVPPAVDQLVHEQRRHPEFRGR
jgi:mRNA-degrading endonuclease toxin of MazEF toxin-antitoxin module